MFKPILWTLTTLAAVAFCAILIVMRAELSAPGVSVLPQDNAGAIYNRLITYHGYYSGLLLSLLSLIFALQLHLRAVAWASGALLLGQLALILAIYLWPEWLSLGETAVLDPILYAHLLARVQIGLVWLPLGVMIWAAIAALFAEDRSREIWTLRAIGIGTLPYILFMGLLIPSLLATNFVLDRFALQGTMVEITMPHSYLWLVLPFVLMVLASLIPKPSRKSAWVGGVAAGVISAGGMVTIFLLHGLGIQGMPRRYVDYPRAFEAHNSIISLVSFAVIAVVLAFALFALFQRLKPRPQ